PNRADEARRPADLAPERAESDGSDDPLADPERDGELGTEPDPGDVIPLGDGLGRKLVWETIEPEDLAAGEGLREPGGEPRHVPGGHRGDATPHLSVGDLERLHVGG